MTNGLLDGGFRFDNFVVGASNRLATSAAHAVADAPGAAYNPLFIYGASGLGKTHLVAAIAHQARQRSPGLQVEFSTGEDLVERLHKAIGTGQAESFATRFQHVRLLILDDVQFLTGQRETQSELLRLFNRLQATGRQLVMTSDRPPAEIPDVDQRLLSRLAGGLVVDVAHPDYEMRLAILRNAAAERTLSLLPGVLEAVAQLEIGNVRALKGALNRLVAFEQAQDEQVQPDDVRAVLGDTPQLAGPAGPAGNDGAAVPPIGNGWSRTTTSSTVEFEGFVADVMQEVETRVEKWRVSLGEACAFWRGEGYITAVLERAVLLRQSPDVNGLLTTFSAAVAHLREIEVQAVALDPALRGDAAFRDPERVASAQRLLDRALASALPLPAPQPQLRRDDLEAGSANQLALKAFDAIIEAPGTRYNPLYLHGPSGVGKTHFAHALGNAMRAAWPQRTVACLSANAFAEEFVAAMQDGGVERWRARYRGADVLILDDVHSLHDRERTQDELFHLFNHLHERGSQIVLTADRPARAVTGLVDRLQSRFDGGLVVALQAPDRALRERVVRRALLEGGHEPSQALVALLADRDVTSIRELRGVLTGLGATASLEGVPFDVELAQRVLTSPVTRESAVAASDVRGGSRQRMDHFFQDREKLIWDWPQVSARLIEEVR